MRRRKQSRHANGAGCNVYCFENETKKLSPSKLTAAGANDARRKKAGIIVATPTRGTLFAETCHCLMNVVDGFPRHTEIVARKGVAEVRNGIAARIRAKTDDKGLRDFFRFVLWVDEDTWWWPGSVASAIEIMSKNEEIAMLCGTTACVCPMLQQHVVCRTETRRNTPTATGNC